MLISEKPGVWSGRKAEFSVRRKCVGSETACQKNEYERLKPKHCQFEELIFRSETNDVMYTRLVFWFVLTSD